MWASVTCCFWALCVFTTPSRVNGLLSTALRVLLDFEYVMFGTGNVGVMPGFSDIYLILMVMPAGVAFVVTMMLIVMSSGDYVLLTPLFENLSFLLPVMIFLRCGLISVELGLVVVTTDSVDMCMLFESSQ
jgi:hypothetical protein